MMKNCDNISSRFHLIPDRYGQRDRQTDGQMDIIVISISRVSVLTSDKNEKNIFGGKGACAPYRCVPSQKPIYYNVVEFNTQISKGSVVIDLS